MDDDRNSAINPNDIVRILPTEFGWKQIRAHFARVNRAMREVLPGWKDEPLPKADEDGYIEGQFHSLIQYFDFEGVFHLPFTELIKKPRPETAFGKEQTDE